LACCASVRALGQVAAGARKKDENRVFVRSLERTMMVLLVMVLQRVLRAAMMAGYRIRLTGSGLSRGVRNRPAHRRHGSVRARARKAVCPDGYKYHDSVHRRNEVAATRLVLTRPEKLFLKIGPSRKITCFAPMNAPLLLRQSHTKHSSSYAHLNVRIRICNSLGTCLR
jgi:hypothetical protein